MAERQREGRTKRLETDRDDERKKKEPERLEDRLEGADPSKVDMEAASDVVPEGGSEVEAAVEEGMGPNNSADADGVEAGLLQGTEEAIDSGIAAANSDMEAAAEEM